jgi:predicted unusual protein kinase regulating ubiquinone biosynthesis (AarF/ABC1/UbiB family)
VALIMTEAYCEQILVHGFFHADPHPGNLLVLPGPVVVFIDFGLSKELPPGFRLNYARLSWPSCARTTETWWKPSRARL